MAVDLQREEEYNLKREQAKWQDIPDQKQKRPEPLVKRYTDLIEGLKSESILLDNMDLQDGESKNRTMQSS